MAKRTFPVPPEDQPDTYALLCIPTHLIPLTAGLFAELEPAWVWATDEDHQRGYTFAAQCQEQLLNTCLTDLIKGQDRLYRLLDSALNGTVYEETGVDPTTNEPIIEPALADIPPTVPQPALRHALYQGLFHDPDLPIDIIKPPYWYIATGQESWANFYNMSNLYEWLQRFVGREPAQDPFIEDFLNNLGNLSSYANFLLNMWQTIRGTTADGGMLLLLLFSVLTQLAVASEQQVDLNRIIKALDGGGLTAPDDNILQALRGTDDSDSTRNVASLLEQLRDRLIEADPEDDSLLEEIRKLLV